MFLYSLVSVLLFYPQTQSHRYIEETSTNLTISSLLLILRFCLRSPGLMDLKFAIVLCLDFTNLHSTSYKQNSTPYYSTSHVLGLSVASCPTFYTQIPKILPCLTLGSIFPLHLPATFSCLILLLHLFSGVPEGSFLRSFSLCVFPPLMTDPLTGLQGLPDHTSSPYN